MLGCNILILISNLCEVSVNHQSIFGESRSRWVLVQLVVFIMCRAVLFSEKLPRMFQETLVFDATFCSAKGTADGKLNSNKDPFLNYSGINLGPK